MSKIMITEDGSFVSLMEYLLLREAIEPVETDYGTDLINRKWKVITNDRGEIYRYTFFNFSNVWYRVGIVMPSGKVEFMLSFEFDKDKIDDIDWLLKSFTDDRRNIGAGLRVINNVIYIIFEFIKQYKPNTIKFDASNQALGNVYSKITKNTHFNKKLKELGYEFDDINNGLITYKKIKFQSLTEIIKNV